MRDTVGMGAVKTYTSLFTVAGITLLVLGVFSMMAPIVAGVWLALVVGVLVLGSGVTHCVFAFKARSFALGLLSFLLGSMAILCGLLMIAHPLWGLGFLTILLVGYFIAQGVCESIFALQLRRDTEGWGWTLFGGILSIILGVLIWRQWPLSGTWAIGILVGIRLIFTGASMMGFGIAARGLADQVSAAAETAPPSVDE
jgi:uncharacterized membrane protein HdeD (DUF308 family)